MDYYKRGFYISGFSNDLKYDPELNKPENIVKMTEQEKIDKLTPNNIPLVISYCKRFAGLPFYEDAVMEGVIGLIKAIKAYKPESNNTLATLAIVCISNQISMMLRKYNKIAYNEYSFTYISKPTSSREIGNIEMDVDITGLEIASYEQEESLSQEKVETINELELILHTLTERERQIITLKHYHNKTQREIAEILGISQSYISRLEVKIYNKMRKKLKGKGIYGIN